MEKFDNKSFEEQKRAYFYSLYRSLDKYMIYMAKNEGLFGPKNTNEDWRNVIKHSIVEVARVSELGKMLKLNEETIENMKIASSLHDIGKKYEIEFVNKNGCKYSNFVKADKHMENELIKHNIPKGIISLLEATGVESYAKIDKLLEKKEWSDDDFAMAIIHYVDDYTINDEWVSDNNYLVGSNALDKRSLRQETKTVNIPLDADVVKNNIFGGKTLHETQRIIGHAIEDRISQRLLKETGNQIDSTKIPEIVDQKIIERIANW